MLHFECDYTQGAHPQILKRLIETNMIATSGYGIDEFCESAANKIKKSFACPDSEVYFLVGGTQTNQTVIDCVLKNWQGVISGETGHINTHEAGAIEHTGHKVLTIPTIDGKISAITLKKFLENFYCDSTWPHMVEPGMVYISFPTEYGTVYSQKELDDIGSVCREYNLPLYIDGARLAYGLAAEGNDVTAQSLAASSDAFYIGGTKVGALFGEAVVFNNISLCPHFFTIMKQHGALLAKGRLLGVQFDTMFTDDLYFEMGRNAVREASKLKSILLERGYEVYIDSPTNQLFIIAEDSRLEELSENVCFDIWGKTDENHTIVRFATSWATNDADLKDLSKYL